MLRFREKRDKLVRVALEIALALDFSAHVSRAGMYSSLSDSRRMLTISIRATGRPPQHGQSCARQPNKRAIPRGTREKARSAGHQPADCRLHQGYGVPGERAAPCKASSFLLSRCGETAPLDRYLKGSGNSFRRVLSFFQNVFPIRRSSAARLEQSRGGRADHPQIGLVQSVGTRVPCRRRFHHLERLDADAINNATRRIGSPRVGRVVSRAVPAALSNVLGSAFGLSHFAFRGAPRTVGRPHRAQPARPPFHRYSDELHVPERGVVVFLHADPILFDLSPALLGGAPLWAMAVSDRRVRRRLFRTLRVAGAVAAKWVVGAWRFRDLSLAGVCAG